MVAIVSEKSKPQLGSEQPEKYVLTASIEPVDVGDKFVRLPTHITMLPPFMMHPSKKDEFDKNFAEVAEENLPFLMLTHEPEPFGRDGEVSALPVSGVFSQLFFGAFVIARYMELPFDDTYSIKIDARKDKSVAMSFGSGDEVESCGGLTVLSSGKPHITDYEGIIGPDDLRHIHEVQLFCYHALAKQVVSTYTRNGYRSVKK